MTTPTTRRGVHKFIGLVNFYQNMWDKNLHTLQPLTHLTPKTVKIKWDFI